MSEGDSRIIDPDMVELEITIHSNTRQCLTWYQCHPLYKDAVDRVSEEHQRPVDDLLCGGRGWNFTISGSGIIPRQCPRDLLEGVIGEAPIDVVEVDDV